MALTDLLGLLENVEGGGERYTAKCPAHDDHKRSLTIFKRADDKIGFHCTAGCTEDDILVAIGWKEKPKEQIETVSAPELAAMELPPIRYIVDEFLPEGTTLLSAASKIGKSWMVLDLGLCAAAGAQFMGHSTTQTGVLYLALEDSFRRLQDRMKKVLNGESPPPLFSFATQAPTLDNGLLDQLDAHLNQHPETKLIIIDTLQKIRGQALPRENAYAQDYREMGTVKSFLDKKGVSVIFVHHNRKMKDDNDIFNMISGTSAIMGAADTIWTITKDKRADDTAILHVTGRDVSQSDTEIRFSKETWRWDSIGDADWLAQQRARLAYQESPIVKTIKKLLEQDPNTHKWSGKAKDLLTAGTYIAGQYLATSPKSLSDKLKNLDGPLLEYDGIIHETTGEGNAGKKHHFYYQDLTRFQVLEPGQFEDLDADEEVPF